MSEAAFTNGDVVARRSIPKLAVGEACSKLVDACQNGRRVVCATALSANEILFVLAHDSHSELELLSMTVDAKSYPSLTPHLPQMHLFERAIFEDVGLRPEGHPGLFPVRFSGIDDHGQRPKPGVRPFCELRSHDCHSVAVGPVHAGVIEPGHFRFECFGERVFHLEIALGYQHRGVRNVFVGGPNARCLGVAETITGDSSIAHSIAYCQAIESLARCRPSPRAHAVRAAALELERVANHVGTLGALAGDVAYQPTSASCGALRGDFLNLTASICGNRFGRGLVRPGGVRFDIDTDRAKEIVEKANLRGRHVDETVSALLRTPSVQSRFDLVGKVTLEDADKYGLVGLAARATGIERDVRHDHPFGHYRVTQVPRCSWPSGDVFSRALVRHHEILRSIELISRTLGKLPRGEVCRTVDRLSPNSVVVSLVEGHRGEVCHVATTGDDGKVSHYDVIDPSFHNWTGLALALVDQEISDFPLCNKSFDLSYCGFDL